MNEALRDAQWSIDHGLGIKLIGSSETCHQLFVAHEKDSSSALGALRVECKFQIAATYFYFRYYAMIIYVILCSQTFFWGLYLNLTEPLL